MNHKERARPQAPGIFEVFFQDRLLGTISMGPLGELTAEDSSLCELVRSVAETNRIPVAEAMSQLDRLLPAGHRTWARRRDRGEIA